MTTKISLSFSSELDNCVFVMLFDVNPTTTRVSAISRGHVIVCMASMSSVGDMVSNFTRYRKTCD